MEPILAQETASANAWPSVEGGIIDFHAHIFPEALASKAVAHIGRHYGIPMHRNGLLEDLIESTDRSGVSQVILLSSATRPAQTQTVNRWLAERQDERFIAFGTLHPDSAHIEQQLEEILSLGLRGVKLHPEFQAFDIDDPKMDRIYRAIGGKLPILMHVGDPKLDHSAPIRLRRVLDRFPDLQLVAAHLGGYERWDEARETLIGLPIWLDTSSALWAMSAEEAIDLIRCHGTDRVVFGTDYPVNSHAQELALFDRLTLTVAERQAILRDNAARILGIRD